MAGLVADNRAELEAFVLEVIERELSPAIVTSRAEFSGVGSPENVITAKRGSRYRREDGGAGTCFYVKESDTGNTGWVAK